MTFKKLVPILAILLFLISLTGVMAQSSPDFDVWLSFDNDTLLDSYGNFSGTNSGTTNTTGILNSGRSLDGINNYLFVSGNAVATSSQVWTLNYWLKPTSCTQDDDGLLNKRVAGTTWDSWLNADCTMKFRVTGTQDISTKALSTTEWNMVTIVYNQTDGGGNDIKIYINGTLSGGNEDATIGSGSQDIVFGSLDKSLWFYLGVFDEMAIIDGYALNQTEIDYLYNSGTGRSPPFGGGVPAVASENFTINATNQFTGGIIQNFSAEINNTNFTTSNYTIITNVRNNETILYDIFVFDAIDTNGKYFNRTYNNVNLSSNMTASFLQTRATFTGTSIISNISISGNISTDATNRGNTNQLLNWTSGFINVKFHNESGGWINKTLSINIPALQDNYSYNFTELYSSFINISAFDALTGSKLTSWSGNITQDSYGYYKTFSTTNGSVLIPLLKDLNYTIVVSANNYSVSQNLSTKTFNVNASSHNISISLYKWNSINIQFFEELSNVLIDHQNITFDLISSVYSNNYTTGNGTLYITLLDPANYTARYSSPNYTERFYYFNVFNNSFNNLTLYLLNKTSASNVTINVIDQAGSPVPNALVKSLRYDLASNTYLLQEVGQTNNDGDVILSLQLNSEYYKFIVEYTGTTLLTTTPAYISSEQFTLQVDLEEGFGTSFYNWFSLDYDLGFNPTTNNFVLTYNDVGGITNEVCLQIFILKVTGRTFFNESCLTTATGTILQNVPAVNGTTYEAVADYTDGNGVNYIIGSAVYTFPDSDVFGNQGLFLQILLSAVIFFITLFAADPTFVAISLPLSLIFGSLIGFNAIGIFVLIPLLVVGIVVAFLLNKEGT